ncbi:MAG: type ISP restriction/modification enzyme [Desulfobacterales bacterium]
MSKQIINNYYSELDRYRKHGGTVNESSVRRAFANLLTEYCRPKNLVPVDEVSLKTSRKRPDGTVKDALQLDWGYWESKDPKDDLDEEIRKKFALGYPKDNIIFENSETIVLIQKGKDVARKNMRDADMLHDVLVQFVSYQRPEIKEFHLAVEKFREHIPSVIDTLRIMTAEQEKSNQEFRQRKTAFWNLCRKSINPEISAFDIQEMIIQHILTSEIFNTVFGESHFHRENSIAKELEAVTDTFFTGALRRNTLSAIDCYYRAIRAEAARIENHHEKQKFLKVIYENFYRAYNPKGADRLGIVYTPNEIVKFIIESTDWLLERHFGKSLADRDVEILDPATGTGTFITDIIEHIPLQYLEHKYKNEIHANEIAILPYYIASLNIEYTYQQKMGKYEPFEHIVFVDTLDNLGFEFRGKQGNFKGFGLSAENLARIRDQNERKISVIFGNPPYNAKQQLYSDFNPNRKYEKIDERIRETYVKHGTAQNQIVLYDMYTRFFRWASDRIDRNGIIAFVSNSTFIDSRTYDGFRKVLAEEFSEIHIVNLKGNARTSGKQRQKEGGNVFDDKIRVGIAVYFLVRKENAEGFRIYYHEVDDYLSSEEKRDYLAENRIQNMIFERIAPDRNSNWIHLDDNDFHELIPLIDKDVKAGKGEQAVFKLFSSGVKTQRDEWVYDFSKENLTKKMNYFIEIYNKTVKNEKFRGRNKIKWDADLMRYMQRKIDKEFSEKQIVRGIYRPFVKKYFYFDRHFNGRTYQWPSIYHTEKANKIILIRSFGSNRPFNVIATDTIAELHVAGANQCIPLWHYDENGSRYDNMTDWGVKQFINYYKDETISREDIFHYVYAVLHNPAYRRKYEISLKREFPRIPFYRDFWQWAEWGKSLMNLHIRYELAEPFELAVREFEKTVKNPKPGLQAIPEKGEILLDENTAVSNIPAQAWEYKSGSLSALEWILDQYKEKKMKDETLAEKFDTYRFADYKEQVIDLLKRVCTVSVRTVEIIRKMETAGG